MGMVMGLIIYFFGGDELWRWVETFFGEILVGDVVMEMGVEKELLDRK